VVKKNHPIHDKVPEAMAFRPLLDKIDSILLSQKHRITPYN
jgi:hypothetical protein